MPQNDAASVFSRFAPFIQDFIYNKGWNELRQVQLDAADVIFNSDDNLLLSSGTASGKTEAVFFPIISDLYEHPTSSFGALYISPLKSLINDQFARLDELLDYSGIPVFHWHGDVAQSEKTRALKNPSGILQITPESLEGMLMHRSNDAIRLFSQLRYVVIDEIHTLTGNDRGNQIICLLCRLGHLIGYHPRRFGLSATVGDLSIAADWLSGGSGRNTAAPAPSGEKLKWRLGLEHFFIQSTKEDQRDESIPGNPQKNTETPDNNTSDAILDPGYEFLYDCTKGKKCLVFSNSREETEYICATLRQIASHRGDTDRFLIHHGNLSSAIREEAEYKLRDTEADIVACATVTLELGIDIGRLERIIHNGAPTSVMSFLQRLGRSGRRDAPPEMMMVFREENPLPNTPLPKLIPWELLRAIAIIQLYIEERFIEPPNVKKLPFSLLFHQTLSILASSGSLTPQELCKKVLSLPVFDLVTKDEYRTLLQSMFRNEFIELTEDKELIIGLKGERLINSYKFLAVFKDSEDYTVRCDSDEIGTITTPPPVGDRFALAGKVWEVVELDIQRKLIYVKKVEGKMQIEWPGDYGEIHTRILERMKQILQEDTIYPYLKKNAVQRLQVARNLAKNTGMLEKSCVHLGGYTWCLFPWLGTRSFRTLRRYIARNSAECKLSQIEYDSCCYMTFKLERGDGQQLISMLNDKVSDYGIDLMSLIGTNERPLYDKYDEYIPIELLHKAFATDRLRDDEVALRLSQLAGE